MRPVAANFEVSQAFGGGATAGVVANPNQNSGMGYYVWLYGNYQPYGHAGMDIACPIGTPIYAPADGEVLYAGWTEDLPGSGSVRKWLLYYNFGGIVTVIQHDGWISVIAHQSTNDAVYAGMKVKEGQFIGKTGNTKTRTTYVAAHVHIEALVYMDYRTDVSKGIVYGRVNPEPFFGAIAAQGSTTERLFQHMTPEEEKEVLTAARRINKYLDAPTGAIPEKVVKALLAERVPRKGGTQTGTTSLGDTLSYADSNFAAIKPKEVK
jgi:murein DD-endopeptidase MepM/ murein hydrolase activator NlpD